MLRLRLLGRIAPLRPAVLAHELLDVRRRAVPRHVHEHGLVRRRGHARHRPNLGVGELALRERIGDLRQLLERARDAHLLARRHGPDTASPIEPLRRVRKAVPSVCLAAIELGDHREEAIRGGVQVSPELGDLRFECVEFAPAAEVGFAIKRVCAGHGNLRFDSWVNVQYCYLKYQRRQ